MRNSQHATRNLQLADYLLKVHLLTLSLKLFPETGSPSQNIFVVKKNLLKNVTFQILYFTPVS